MKIIACVRTKNEELNVGRFCESYQWADEIIIADGGSEDKTLSIARKFPNVHIYVFPEKVWSRDKKVWGNPIDRHCNFLFDRAIAHEADWIIFDDCDCVPNMYLKRDGRTILEQCKNELVMVNRIYIYGQDRFFEGLTKPDGNWTPSLWAWKKEAGVHANPIGDWHFEMNLHMRTGNEYSAPSDSNTAHNLWPPYALMHYFYPSDEYMKNKLEFYGHETPLLDPKEYGGIIRPLPEWAIE